MQQQQLPVQYGLELALELRARQARAVERERLATEPTRTLRVTVGLGLVRLGQRLAAQPPLQPAGPR
jgi:hypothetical protein